MKISKVIAAVVFLFAGSSSFSAAENAGARVPVLLELFTSEGCSSCPPADRLLEILDRTQPVPNADLIVLSEHVDYWNRLGWKDPFSSALYSSRQQEYSDRNNSNEVYTPQLVIDGRSAVVGSNKEAVLDAAGKAARESKFPIEISNVTHDGDHVGAHIEWRPAAAMKESKAELYVAVADNRAESEVSRGENAGRNLAHVAVTRTLQNLGSIDVRSASAKDVKLPFHSSANGSRIIAFLQDSRSGRVLGAAARNF